MNACTVKTTSEREIKRDRFASDERNIMMGGGGRYRVNDWQRVKNKSFFFSSSVIFFYRSIRPSGQRFEYLRHASPSPATATAAGEGARSLIFVPSGPDYTR